MNKITVVGTSHVVTLKLGMQGMGKLAKYKLTFHVSNFGAWRISEFVQEGSKVSFQEDPAALARRLVDAPEMETPRFFLGLDMDFSDCSAIILVDLGCKYVGENYFEHYRIGGPADGRTPLSYPLLRQLEETVVGRWFEPLPLPFMNDNSRPVRGRLDTVKLLQLFERAAPQAKRLLIPQHPPFSAADAMPSAAETRARQDRRAMFEQLWTRICAEYSTTFVGVPDATLDADTLLTKDRFRRNPEQPQDLHTNAAHGRLIWKRVLQQLAD